MTDETRPVVFTAYVAGPAQATAIRSRLAELCAAVGLEPEVRVVDVHEQPQAAEEGNVIGIPTVVRESPAPRRRVIGSLDDTRRVSAALGLEDLAGWDRSA